MLNELPDEETSRSKVTFNVAVRNRNKPVIGKLSKQKEEEALNQVRKTETQTETNDGGRGCCYCGCRYWNFVQLFFDCLRCGCG